jgi:hypothetical protein
MARRWAGWPSFTGIQLRWLLTNGHLKEPERYVFYFETAGLGRFGGGKPIDVHPPLSPFAEKFGRYLPIANGRKGVGQIFD